MERFIDVREVPDELGKKENRGIKRKHDQPLHDLRQGSRGLRRPKRPLSFQISGLQKNHPHRASTDSPVSTAVDALEKRIHLVDLIVRRNKNQHRNQPFFKHLCLLRKSLARLLDVSSRLAELSRSVVSARSSEQVRRNFEVEASLRSQRDVLEEHVREVLVPKSYTTFSGLVGDSQFGNLGVVLVALLSEIACGGDGVGAMRVVQDDEEVVSGRSRRGGQEEQDTPSEYVGSFLGMSTRATGEDQGEIVERVYSRGVVEREDGTDSEDDEWTHQILSGQDGENDPSRGDTSPGDMRGMQREDLVKVKQTLNKTEKETAKEIGKSKKPKKTIDDLFSGLL